MGKQDGSSLVAFSLTGLVSTGTRSVEGRVPKGRGPEFSLSLLRVDGTSINCANTRKD